MSPMKLHVSNRLEILADELALVLAEPLGSVFTPEIIVVQSKGMERWVSMQLAQRHGICANCRFPFPNAFVQELFGKTHADLPDVSAHDPQYLTWRIMQALPGLILEPGFEQLRRYLGDGTWELKHLQLSRSIAETFDQYVLYRPDWISRWEGGEEDHWQAVLWRTLCEGLTQKHRAAAAQEFFQTLQACRPETCDLPRRVSVFGISYLPPFHLQALDQLAAFTQVHLFLLNPCGEYWGDIASRSDLRRLGKAASAAALDPGVAHLETGNSLLASMGVMGRDFFDLLWEFGSEQLEHFRDPGKKSLLACIQSDILHLTETGSAGRPSTAAGSFPMDRSIEILSCHSPMREVEVLHDHLLEMFERDGELLPGDILVMTPDIETYAPFVHAVFGSPESPRHRIPYSISDRSMRGESRILDTFLSILELPMDRFSAPQVLSILESPAVQARFGLEEGDLDTVARWVRDTRIRWGWDQEARKRWSAAAGSRNTWRSGLDRLLLGFAMPGKGVHLFQGVLPYDDLEGGETLVLGKFLDFMENLHGFMAAMEERRSLTGWTQCLVDLVNAFFLPDEGAVRDRQVLLGVLEQLGETGRVSGFEGVVDLSTVRWHLRRHLEGGSFGYGFMTGGVTFCSMLPMRSIPFKVICLLGMDVNAYPRRPRNPEFDLMVKSPRKGDRSPRNDDRYLFLETLLSAREKLIICYTGQSPLDNSPIPPSVLVSELLEYMARILDSEPKHLVTRHRLQPFSSEYFKGGGPLFSYSQAHCAASRELLGDKASRPPFISTILPDPPQDWRRVDMIDLRRFFANPCRFFLQMRLGLFLEEGGGAIEETEPFQLDGLERYRMDQDLLEGRLEDLSWDCLRASQRASGSLPHGQLGEWALDRSVRGVDQFLTAARPFMREGPLEPLGVDLALGDFQLHGNLTRMYPSAMFHYRLASIKAKDFLDLWIEHLILNEVGAPGYPARSILLGLQWGRRQAYEMIPVESPRSLLQELLEIYWEGLSRPLHFFPRSSCEYAVKIHEGSSREKALAAAGKEWSSQWKDRSESDDPYLRMCLGESDPLDERFESLSTEIFLPLLRALQELKP